MSRVIGLTGGIGSGKSTVASFLSELGATIIDSDKIGHEVYQPNTEVWRQIVKSFGEQILTRDNTIDRKKLGEIVFDCPELLKKLTNLVHPAIFQIVTNRIEEARKQGIEVVVLEGAVLFESGGDRLMDEVWTVAMDKDNVIRRVTARSGLSEGQICSRIQTQMSDAERIRRADVVIYNDGTLENLRVKVKELWDKLKV